MPTRVTRKRSRAKPNPALAELRDKIREAEKAQAPVARELVALDQATYERLAVLVQRGLGKKPGVLAQALALGLEALTNTSAAPTMADPPRTLAAVHDLFPRSGADDDEPDDEGTGSSLAASALGGSFAFGNTVAAIPPSQQRRLEAEAEAEAGEHNDGD